MRRLLLQGDASDQAPVRLSNRWERARERDDRPPGPPRGIDAAGAAAPCPGPRSPPRGDDPCWPVYGAIGLDVPYEPEADTERNVDRTALAVLERARDDLVDTPFSLVVANEHARVIERVDGDPGLAAKLDHLHLVPGFRWSEQCIGTNAIGTGARARGVCGRAGTRARR